MRDSGFRDCRRHRTTRTVARPTRRTRIRRHRRRGHRPGATQPARIITRRTRRRHRHPRRFRFGGLLDAARTRAAVTRRAPVLRHRYRRRPPDTHRTLQRVTRRTRQRLRLRPVNPQRTRNPEILRTRKPRQTRHHHTNRHQPRQALDRPNTDTTRAEPHNTTCTTPPTQPSSHARLTGPRQR